MHNTLKADKTLAVRAMPGDWEYLNFTRVMQFIGPLGIIAEMLIAAGKEKVELMRQLVQSVFSCGVIPGGREKSFILNLYRVKVEGLDGGNCRGLKLTDQAMKLLERVLDFYIREIMNVIIKLMRCSLALFLVGVPLTPSSLFDSCRRSTLPLTNLGSTLHSLI